jgi:hypothetical protein
MKTKYHLGLLLIISGIISSCASRQDNRYVIHQQAVIVDGIADEWENIQGNTVDKAEQLWIGQGMLAEYWKGKEDLSFHWKACREDNKIYFLFDVNDDVLVEPPGQPNSWLNDCVEIVLDPRNQRGPRFIEDEQGKELFGYEMHFMPSSPNHVFVNDALSPLYPVEMAQDSLFKTRWDGEIATSKSQGSYIMEIGFEVPGLSIYPGLEIGIDVVVCDDDGEGRKSLLIWSGVKNEYWLTMDDYPRVIF